MNLKEFLRQFQAAPNIISVSRLLFLPPLVYLLYKDEVVWAIILMFIIWISDFIDGYVARRFQLKTDLGLILDPVADKITTAVLLLTLFKLRDFPLWIALIMIIRDMIIISGGLYILNRGNIMHSHEIGRMTTVLVSIIIFLYIVNLEHIGRILSYLLIVCIAVTLCIYSSKFIELLKQKSTIKEKPNSEE